MLLISWIFVFSIAANSVEVEYLNDDVRFRKSTIHPIRQSADEIVSINENNNLYLHSAEDATIELATFSSIEHDLQSQSPSNVVLSIFDSHKTDNGKIIILLGIGAGFEETFGNQDFNFRLRLLSFSREARGASFSLDESRLVQLSTSEVLVGAKIIDQERVIVAYPKEAQLLKVEQSTRILDHVSIDLSWDAITSTLNAFQKCRDWDKVTEIFRTLEDGWSYAGESISQGRVFWRSKEGQTTFRLVHRDGSQRSWQQSVDCIACLFVTSEETESPGSIVAVVRRNGELVVGEFDLNTNRFRVLFSFTNETNLNHHKLKLQTGVGSVVRVFH